MAETTVMRAEIAEQPDALRRTLDVLPPRMSDVGLLARGTRQVLFIARGSSDNAAVYGRYLIESRTGRPAALAAPSIATLYRSRIDLSGVLAVALSQSGETAEIVETLAWAADCGARTLAITNQPRSALARAAQVALCTEAGDEVAVPATKTYTAQLAALAVLALGLGADLDASLLHKVPDELARLIDEVERSAVLDEMAAELAEVPGMVVSGRGLVFGTALELALKAKEACYLQAMGLSYADLLHGPIAVVDDRTPAILVAAGSGPALPGTVALAERVTAAGARVYGVGGGPGLAVACTRALPGPDLPEWLAPLALIVPGQLLVERLAGVLGVDPDVPRGLHKVTTTD